MNRLWIAITIPAALAVAAVAVTVVWISASRPSYALVADLERVSIKDATVAGGPTTALIGPMIDNGKPFPQNTVFEGNLGGVPDTSKSSWPWFRGPKFDGVVPTDTVKVIECWPGGKPKELWSIDNLGDGYSGPAIANGRVYLLDYDQHPDGPGDQMRCFSLKDGKEIWRRGYPLKIKPNHGYSRSVPAVNEKYCVSIGPTGVAMCVDAITGDLKWGIDMVRDHGAVVPEWYTSQCPFFEPDGKTTILAPGGPDALLMGVDCETGKVLWKSPNPRKWRMSHSSITPLDFKGTRMYVYVALSGVVGVSTTGTTLWEVADWSKISAEVPVPVIVSEGKLFLARPYGGGSAMITLSKNGEKITAAVERFPKAVFGSEQQTPIFYNGMIYGTKAMDSGDGEFVALSPDVRKVWGSGNDRFGKSGGPYLIAGGIIFVMDDHSKLTMIRAAGPASQTLKDGASAQVLPGIDSFAPMAMVDGKLLVRDGLPKKREKQTDQLSKLVCLQVGEPK
jgi:outer membrane protein assembly factor BamB